MDGSITKENMSHGIIDYIKQRLQRSKLLQDSLWSVLGSGFGNFLLLIAGIVIARFLGKDIYGEYGMVKTTMFYFASFATFGLGFTSTKYIADFLKNKESDIVSIIRSSLVITLLFSVFICVVLLLFSGAIASFINEPKLKTAFQYLGVIIVFRSLTTTGTGLLSGFKRFDTIGIAGIISGAVLLVLGTVLTYLNGLTGSLVALLLSQMTNSIVVLIKLKQISSTYSNSGNNYYKELIVFSFPIALQELSYAVCSWATMLVLAKYSSVGEVGLWSASAQWHSVALLIPGLLSNMVLSYMASATADKRGDGAMVKKMMIINLLSALIPFIVIIALQNVITSYYGPTFSGLPKVLNMLMVSTFFVCAANVLQSNLIATGKNWMLFTFRLIRDLTILLLLFFILKESNEDAAFKLSMIYVLAYFVYFSLMTGYYFWGKKQTYEG